MLLDAQVLQVFSIIEKWTFEVVIIRIIEKCGSLLDVFPMLKGLGFGCKSNNSIEVQYNANNTMPTIIRAV